MKIADDKKTPLKWLWNSNVREHFIFLFIALIFMSIEGSMLGLLSYSIKFLFDNVLVSKDTSSILLVAILIFSIFSIRAIAGFTHRLMTVNVCQKIIKTLQDRMVEHLINMDVGFHQKNSPGKLMDRVRADSKALSESIGEAFMTIGRDGFSLISGSKTVPKFIQNPPHRSRCLGVLNQPASNCCIRHLVLIPSAMRTPPHQMSVRKPM